MLYYDRINVSEGIDVNKPNKSKECNICHYWYFLKGINFQPYACNRHDLLMMSMNLSDICIFSIRGAENRSFKLNAKYNI